MHAERAPLPPLDRIRPEHMRYVRSLLGRFRVKPAHWQEDLAQEVLLRAHRSRCSPLEARALLYGISRHVVLTWRARRRAELDALSLHGGGDLATARTAEDDRLEQEWRDAVNAAIASLPKVQREVVLLAWMEDRAMPEVAKRLEIPLNTGYSRLRAAHGCLQRLLERALGPRREQRQARVAAHIDLRSS